MAWRDVFRAISGTAPAPQSIVYTEQHVRAILGQSVEQLWRTQPYLRTVVTFLARNIAQLGLHTFERVSDTDRRRLRDDPVAALLGRPNASQTSYELIYNLVADVALYDEAIWAFGEDADSASGWFIRSIPPSWIVRRGGGSAFEPAWMEFQAPTDRTPTRVDMENVLWFHGWNPGAPASASSPVDALKQILAEQISAQQYRQQVWARGGRVGSVLTRPVGAKWDPKTREKFQRQWQAKYADNDGAAAGGTPILEDGMTLQKVGFSAHEDEYVEGARLALTTVASVYHVNPTMIGQLDNANFSNVREFRKMLYGDTLGPLTAMFEDRINTFLVPRVTNRDGVYVEFNIAEKLQGNFEEQSAAMSSAVGRPWMTADEARARQNMPSLGGDAAALVTPLNVLVGGQASPRDSAPPAPSEPKAEPVSETVRKEEFDLGELGKRIRRIGYGLEEIEAGKSVTAKSRAPETYEQRFADVLRSFFARQKRIVLSELSRKNTDWWDAERWDRELTADLYKLAVLATAQVGETVAKSLGFDPDEFDIGRTLAFLRKVAESRAGAINSTTRDQIVKALESDDEENTPKRVLEEAESTRSGLAAVALLTTFSAFATTESAKQVAGDRATKTWITTSKNPRSEHAAMNGETVGIEETFSNGANWPGDPVLGAEGVSNCLCDVEINIP